MRKTGNAGAAQHTATHGVVVHRRVVKQESIPVVQTRLSTLSGRRKRECHEARHEARTGEARDKAASVNVKRISRFQAE